MLKHERVTGRGWLLPSAVPVLLLVPLLALRHQRVIYTSDSAAQQSIVRTWLDVGHGVASVPPDTWALKVPLYLLLESLPLSPRERLLGAVLVLNVLTFVLLAWAVRRLAAGWNGGARWYEVALPLAWLAALGGGIGSNRMLPNYRNIELGLSFVVLAVVAGYLGAPRAVEQPTPGLRDVGIRDVSPRALGTAAGSALLLGLLWFDDPYVELLVGAPFALAALLWFGFRERDRRLLHLAGVLLASAVVTSLLRVIAGLAGIQFDSSGGTFAVTPADLRLHLSLLIPSTTLQLGVNDWHVGVLDAVTQVLVVAVAVLMLLASAALARHGWRQGRLVVTFLAVHWPLVVAGFLVSWQTQNISASRYLILAVCDVAVATAVLLPELRAHRQGWAKAVAGLLAVGAVLSFAAGVRTAADAASRPSAGLPHQRAVVAAIRQAVREHGAVKGYAPFWDANINTYLAGDGTTAAELVCRSGTLSTRQWLSDTARLTRPAAAVFMIWDPSAPTLAGCSPAERDAQLGAPLATYPLTPTAVPTPGGGVSAVLVYAGDIRDKLGPDPDEPHR